MQATRRMPLWALAIALATGKNTKLFGMLDQNENGFFTYVSQRAGSKVARSSRAISLGSFTVRWQGTSCSSSFVSKVLGANYNRANNFHPVADKFAMCTNGGQEVTFEPTSNAHARVDYNTCCIIDLITIKPNPAAFYFLLLGTKKCAMTK